jgi:hypothetical protein
MNTAAQLWDTEEVFKQLVGLTDAVSIRRDGVFPRSTNLIEVGVDGNCILVRGRSDTDLADMEKSEIAFVGVDALFPMDSDGDDFKMAERVVSTLMDVGFTVRREYVET